MRRRWSAPRLKCMGWARGRTAGVAMQWAVARRYHLGDHAYLGRIVPMGFLTRGVCMIVTVRAVPLLILQRGQLRVDHRFFKKVILRRACTLLKLLSVCPSSLFHLPLIL